VIEQLLRPLLPFGWGMLLGIMFYGGLWLSLSHLPRLKRPALWLAASLLVRMALVVVGLYAIAAGQWQRLLVCLAGFLLMRTLLVRFLAKPPGLSARGA
jgi:F1F0 ATPase subunit 2